MYSMTQRTTKICLQKHSIVDVHLLFANVFVPVVTD